LLLILLLPSFLSFYLPCYRAIRDLHSFPTRRSSDLLWRSARSQAGRRGLGKESPLRPPHQGTKDGTLSSLADGWRSHPPLPPEGDRKSTRLNSSHVSISYAVFCLKKKKKITQTNVHR